MPAAPPGILALGAPGEISGEIVQMDSRGHRQKTIVRDGVSDPVFSRDGTRLAYLRSLNELWVARADGWGGRRLLRTRGQTMSRPTWSPDGRRIAYAGPAPVGAADRRSGLWIVDTAGSRRRRVTSVAAGGEPDWSPDGRWFVYADAGLRLVSSDGKRRRAIAARAPFGARWSPSGKWIAYQIGPDEADRFALRIVEAATGRQRTVARYTSPTSLLGPIAWSPSGTWLAYADAYEVTVTYDEILFELRVVRVGDGARRLVLDTGMTEIYGLTWRR